MARENKANRQMRRLVQAMPGILAQQETVETVTAHSGPLPDPDTLIKYDQAFPGLADRIVRMAEGESTHRRDLEKQLLTAQIKDAETDRQIEQRGQTFALVVSLVIIIGGVTTAILGYPVAGTLLSGGTVATLAGLFIYGRRAAQPKAAKPAAPGDAKAETTLPANRT